MDSDFAAAGYDYKIRDRTRPGPSTVVGAWKIVSDWRVPGGCCPFLKFCDRRWTHPAMRTGDRLFVLTRGEAFFVALDAVPLHLKATGEHGGLTPLTPLEDALSDPDRLAYVEDHGYQLLDAEGMVSARWVRVKVSRRGKKTLHFGGFHWTHASLPAGGFAFVVVTLRLDGLLVQELAFVQGATPASVAAMAARGEFRPLTALDRQE